MRTSTEMKQRFCEQHARREEYIAARAKGVVEDWTGALEKKMELAYGGKDPVACVTVYSSSITGSFNEHFDEIIGRAAEDTALFFRARGFRASVVVSCTSHTGVQVYWS